MAVISCILHIAVNFTLVVLLLAWHCKAQSFSGYTDSARQLDSLLQNYAFAAFDRPRTGTPYVGSVPSNLTGIKLSVLRLRCGSLRSRGFNGYNEFDIPTDVIVQPYVKRLAFVYQNLGNLSSFYYPLEGYAYLAPVLGLLAYSAANLSATGLSELDIMALGSPISIKFRDVRPALSGFTAKCVMFDLNGTSELTDLIAGNVCTSFRQGHFAIVVNSSGIAPSPAPSFAPSIAPGPNPIAGSHKGHKVWKIVVSSVAGFVGLLLVILLVTWLASYRKTKKLMEMQKREEVGEVLRMSQVGNTRVPVAPMTRTQPVIENDYVP